MTNLVSENEGSRFVWSCLLKIVLKVVDDAETENVENVEYVEDVEM